MIGGRSDNDPLDLSRLYQHRFTERDLEFKRQSWEVLCRRVFQRYVRPTEVDALTRIYTAQLQKNPADAAALSALIQVYSRSGDWEKLLHWTRERAEHLKDGEDFMRDIDKGTLPAVSFYKPEGVVNDTFNVGAKIYGTPRSDFQAVLNAARLLSQRLGGDAPAAPAAGKRRTRTGS